VQLADQDVGSIRISGTISSAFSALPPANAAADEGSGLGLCDLPQHHFSSRGTIWAEAPRWLGLEHGFQITAQTPQDSGSAPRRYCTTPPSLAARRFTPPPLRFVLMLSCYSSFDAFLNIAPK